MSPSTASGTFEGEIVAGKLSQFSFYSQVRFERAEPVGRGHALRPSRGDRHHEEPPLRRTLQSQELRLHHSQPGKSTFLKPMFVEFRAPEGVLHL